MIRINRLQIYKEATLLFLTDLVSTIVLVIPMMDQIDALLKNANGNPLASQSTSTIQKLTCLMHTGLPRVCFMALLVVSLLMSQAIVLHPQMKLKYFQQQGWFKEWIDTAEAIVQEEFEKYANKNQIPQQNVCVSSRNCLITILMSINSGAC